MPSIPVPGLQANPTLRLPVPLPIKDAHFCTPAPFFNSFEGQFLDLDGDSDGEAIDTQGSRPDTYPRLAVAPGLRLSVQGLPGRRPGRRRRLGLATGQGGGSTSMGCRG